MHSKESHVSFFLSAMNKINERNTYGVSQPLYKPTMLQAEPELKNYSTHKANQQNFGFALNQIKEQALKVSSQDTTYCRGFPVCGIWGVVPSTPFL